jgi:hypothetical protein
MNRFESSSVEQGEGKNRTLRCFKSNQIENKYGENENTTIHKRNDRLDFGLRLKCAFSHFNFGLTKFRIVKMAYLSTFLCAIVLFFWLLFGQLLSF